MPMKSLRLMLMLFCVAVLAALVLTARASATSLSADSPRDGIKERQVGLSPSGTSVSGILTSNTTWTTAGSPYTVVGNVTVLPTVTLTISPGVEVDFNQSL